MLNGLASSDTEAGPCAQPRQHRPPGRVGQSRKGMIEARIVKHGLNYRELRAAVKTVKPVLNFSPWRFLPGQMFRPNMGAGEVW